MTKMRSLRFLVVAAITLCLARKGPADETESFTLTAEAPSAPALKYELLFEAKDREPGNAAVFYMQAMLFGNPDLYNKEMAKAEDAEQRNEDVEFKKVMNSVQSPVTMQKLEAGGMCEGCDWQPEVRQRGFHALLPYLNNARSLGRLVEMTAAYQMRTGATEKAVPTLRLGYELGRNVARDPVMVSGLVGVGITRLMNQRLMELMSRADSPNLYWALATLPSGRESMVSAMEGEQIGVLGEFHMLSSSTVHDLSGDDWQTILEGVAKVVKSDFGGKARPEFSRDNSGADLTAAQKYYADTREVAPDQAAKEDWTKVLGIYYYEQYQAAVDESLKYSRLPYAVALAGLERADAKLSELKRQHPANPFLGLVPSFRKFVLTYAIADREVAAMADVEAIRSYAAANNGQVPAHLEDILETPALEDPVTAKPFDYRVDGGVATLSDGVAGGHALKYTIRVQQ
jgi:hypothetical protein